MADKKKLVVCLCGGGPWGFRLQGGAGTGLPLVVSKVRRKSKAYKKLFEGDLILSVNDQSCRSLTYDQVMDIADKSGDELTLEVIRKDSNKENFAPVLPSAYTDTTVRTSSPLKTLENGTVTQEIISLKETSTKTKEETEGLRIKSATLLPADSTPMSSAFEDFTSKKLNENFGPETETNTNVDPFPPFSELLTTGQGPPKPPRSPVDNTTSSRTEEVVRDDKGFVKTTVETKHEVLGNTEVSFTKKEQESVSKSSAVDSESIPNITMDAMDLNDLISATQKRLDSFKTGQLIKKSDVPMESLANSYEVKKIEKTTSVLEKKTEEAFSSFSSSSKTTEDAINSFNSSLKTNEEAFNSFSSPLKTNEEAFSSQFSSTVLDSNSKNVMVDSKKTENEEKDPPPVPPKPKNRPLSDPMLGSFTDYLKEMQRNLDDLNGGLGFTSDESSFVSTETPFGSTIITKKKKMFSSSSFFEEKDSLYPTVEEQVEMARKIADSLTDDTNRKSKGTNMFYKRVKKSPKWVHEGPSDESAPGTPEIQGVEPPTPDPSQVPFRPSKGPTNLKLVMDSRHPLDAMALKSSGVVFNEHNVISPQMCHGLVKDLHSPVGKGAALFAKRKKKSEDWVVDEERVKSMLRQNEHRTAPMPQPQSYNQYSTFSRQESIKLVQSPWEAAMASPFGLCDAAFSRVHPDQLADTVIRAADTKRRNSNTPTVSRQSSRMEGCFSPPPPVVLPPVTPAAAQYDIYHAKAPKGWAGFGPTVDSSVSFQNPTVPTPAYNPQQDTSQFDNGFSSRKMVFQNFNTLPRLWKGTSAR